MCKFIAVTDIDTGFDVFLNLCKLERFENYSGATGSVINLSSGDCLRVSETCEEIAIKIQEANNV